MNKGVFLCVGTGGHVLPAYNVIKSMLGQGIDKKNILIVTDERGIEYFKEKDFETIVYPFVSSRKGITCLLYTSPSPRDRQKSRMPSSA